MKRREFIATGGALIVSFALPAWGQTLPGALDKEPLLDAWLRVAADGRITVFTGKAELGQGIKTAILQIAAEQLGVDLSAIELVTADTARTPNEGYTAGSNSMKDSGTAILHAAAQAREILICRRLVRQVTGDDHLLVPIHCRLGIVALHPTPVAPLHDPALRIGEVALRLLLGRHALGIGRFLPAFLTLWSLADT